MTTDKSIFNYKKIKVYKDNKDYTTGVEVIAFSDDDIIEELSIVDEKRFNELVATLNNIDKSFVHTTQQDKENIQLLEQKDTGVIASDDPRLQNMTWSNWYTNKVPLDTILANDKGTNTQQPYIINASTLDSYKASDFSLKGHQHTGEFLPDGHKKLIATETVGDNYESEFDGGHVSKIVNNLNTTSYVTGEVLSAYQGNILDNKITNLSKANKWSKRVEPNSYTRYKINKDLRLCNLGYSRENFTGLKDKTGKTVLHSKILPEPYAPGSLVTTPLYRGDVTFYVDTKGSLCLYNLTKIDSIDIKIQLLWKY